MDAIFQWKVNVNCILRAILLKKTCNKKCRNTTYMTVYILSLDPPRRVESDLKEIFGHLMNTICLNAENWQGVFL